jgi:integrase/recombinase XerD
VFDHYFCPRVVARLRASPDASWLGSFLAVLHERGHARSSVQVYVREAELFGLWLRSRRRQLGTVTDADMRAFVARPPRSRPRRTAGAAVRRLLRHLRDRELVPRPPARFPASIERVVRQYDSHLQDVVGAAPATRLYCRRYAGDFLHAVFADQPIRWSVVRVQHVRSFVFEFGRSGRLAAARVGGVAIRCFLRWLEFRGRVGPHLAAAVPRFPGWRLATLPPTLTEPQLASILASFDRTTPVGRRDYAMAALLIDLGMRAGDVAELRVVDIELDAGVLRLGGGKSRRERVLPMTTRVRRAIGDYLRRGRPATEDPHLFVRHRLPFGVAVNRELVRGVIRRAYAAVPGCEALTGTHVLRHTAASRLLRAGADLKRIADILGHRSLDTTAVYAKIDDDRLITVALPWPAIREGQP